MPEAEMDNLRFAESQGDTDRVNAAFYGTFPFPWSPYTFDRLADAGFWFRMLGHDLGEWTEPRSVPQGARIWVAGCGTNQAVFAALKFPTATVVGSDLSGPSLDIASASAASLGVDNLELRRESINDVEYAGCFDYIICTGVVHHNADPSRALARLAAALKPTGVIELMVYNRYHRLQTTAFQRAIQLLHGDADPLAFDAALELSRRAMRGFWLPGSASPVIDVVGAAPTWAAQSVPGTHGERVPKLTNSMSVLLDACGEVDEVALADALFQPVEQSYTVESLSTICESKGLRLAGPCVDQFDKVEGRISWNAEFEDPTLGARYQALPDVVRWQITNLLLQEVSPRLWFYVRRIDCPFPILSETELCAQFLNLRCARARTECRIFAHTADGAYRPRAGAQPFPGTPSDPIARRVHEVLDETRPVSHTLDALGVSSDFRTVNKLRINLATQAFPFLHASRR